VIEVIWYDAATEGGDTCTCHRILAYREEALNVIKIY